MGTQGALEAVRGATSLLEAIRRADELTLAASRDGGPRAVLVLAAAAADPSDQLTAIAAVHALAQVFDQSADEVLVGLLAQDVPFLREHTAWALGTRLPRLDAVAGLVAMVVDGGFPGMLAQRTLEQWGGSAPDHVALALEGALLGIDDPPARARLVETAGLVPGRIPERILRRAALRAGEATVVRAAGIAGLGDRTATDAVLAVLSDLAQGADELADLARLALVDLTVPEASRAPWNQGMTIAQLFLHADLDRDLAQVGAGDNGGIATLLVRLGDALVAGDVSSSRQVERVVTISRGRPAQALSCLAEIGSTVPGHSFAAVPFLGEPVASVDAWPQRVAAQRGIRRVLRAAGPVDAIHLRMADVGSLAAATVARERDLPILFTVAPDPHAAIETLAAAGTLTRANFGSVDETEHFWFRVRLVQRLTADAAHLVLFPRPNLAPDLRRLVGLDLDAHPERYSVIAEGIDLGVIDRSLADARGAIGTAPHLGSTGQAALGALDALLSDLPPARRGLPLAVTVGRLHQVKGMATLVEVWAQDPALRERCNLLVVGGDLTRPSVAEQGQLTRIASAVPDGPRQGLLLAGHRANGTVARWLAAARYGRPGLAAPHGVYVCASVKEEFGIALLEAMATGLTVVAPSSGGPATYVEDGVTGLLVETRDPRALAGAIAAALDLASGPHRDEGVERARDMVRAKFTIQAMATRLSDAYRRVAAPAGSASWAMIGS
ncbi:glycosyltransferase [Pengzhenrongella frigida]|uniref:D-inositol 3-phosphate glycosyltransferase n=1 Tax=Pengzhenrongella frigida TaxID=1259133 RepID=A0A4Q5MWX4_9MICO|nr:glycosyltransferase [Cellulomonas sp. HLT2-17]RYV50085.1 glycosyltransferase [Cellulomonas sp. HLT2-17]